MGNIEQTPLDDYLDMRERQVVSDNDHGSRSQRVSEASRRPVR